MESNKTMLEEQRLAKKKRKKKAQRRRTIVTCILVLMIMASSTVAGYYAYKCKLKDAEVSQAKLEADAANQSYDKLVADLEAGGFITLDEAKNQADEAVAANTEDYLSRIRGYMESGQGTLTMLENLFPNNIVVPDTGKYNFFDIDNTLKLSELDFDKFEYPFLNEDKEYEGEATYSDGTVTAKKGVDVSKFQGDIDWEKVKNDGVEYAYIRLGYRGYESGKIVVDDKYEDNIAACNEVGLDCGVYFFTEAKTEAEGIEEAEFVLENLGDYEVQLPIVIDIEESANVNKSRTKNLSKEDRTKAIIAFCEKLKQEGYEPMLYGNLKSMMLMTDIYQLEDYDKWFAYYHYPLRFPYKIKIWQYTSAGKVDGIKGSADLNLMFY